MDQSFTVVGIPDAAGPEVAELLIAWLLESGVAFQVDKKPRRRSRKRPGAHLASVGRDAFLVSRGWQGPGSSSVAAFAQNMSDMFGEAFFVSWFDERAEACLWRLGQSVRQISAGQAAAPSGGVLPAEPLHRLSLELGLELDLELDLDQAADAAVLFSVTIAD